MIFLFTLIILSKKFRYIPLKLNIAKTHYMVFDRDKEKNVLMLYNSLVLPYLIYCVDI